MIYPLDDGSFYYYDSYEYHSGDFVQRTYFASEPRDFVELLMAPFAIAGDYVG